MIAYILPFAAYIVITMIANLFPHGNLYGYPIKTLIVSCILIYFRNTYSELFTGISNRSITRSIILGSIVFIIWILPEGLYPYLGYSEFDPTEVSHLPLRYLVIIFRVLGSALVVPIFEELFWRSFLARWIIRTDFKKVQIGSFTPFSFVIISLFFGVEHHRWLVGIAAGILYNWLLYKEKKLLPCIIAHLVTNLLLAIYVLITSQWSYW